MTDTSVRPRARSDDVAPAQRSPRRAASIALALIVSVQLMVILDMTVVNVALPDIKDTLGFSSTGLSWVLNAYTLAFGGLLLLGARAGDIVGRRLALGVGIAVFTVASLLGGLADSSGWLLAARALQGIGAALAAPQALALLTTMFPEGRERNRALALYSAVSVGGAAVGLIVGGMLTDWVSWRWAFFINIPVGLAIIALTPRFLAPTPPRPGRFDLAGAVTSTLGMTALVFGFIRAADEGWSDNQALGAFGLGLVLLVAFAVVELRVEQPIVPLGLLAHRDRASAYLGRLLLVAGMMGMFFFLTQYLQEVRDLSPLATGVVFLPLTVTLLVASQLSARVLVERVGGRALMIGGIATSSIAMIWLTQLTADSGYGSIVGPLLLFGLGNGLAFVPLTALGLAGVSADQAGAASGLTNVVQQVGGSLGLAVLVTVFGTAVRDADSSASSPIAREHDVLTHGISTAFVGATAFVLATLVVVAVVARNRPRDGVAT
jgi:EmrB/QacA subfamily drug resistance transporter